jgi:DNA topoisomerase-1
MLARIFKIRDTKFFLHFHDDFDPQEERDPSGKWTKGGGGEATTKVKLERKPRRGSVSGSFEPLEKKEAGAKEAGKKKKPDVWTLPGGKPLPKHIQKLLGYKAIPPKWTDVRYNPDPKGELLIVGRDDKNRQQPLYSEKHDKSQAADKFNRSQRLDGKFDSIMAKNAKCRSSKIPKVRDMASVLALIMHTGIRPGGDADTKAEFKSYGATTLLGRHVTDINEKGELILRFVSGKKHGQEIDIHVDDPEIIKDLQQRAKQVGPEGQLFPAANARYMLNHVKSLAGASFKTKDFRTLLGTRVGATEVAKMPIPQSPAEYKKFVKEVATKVSEVLGNTPAVAQQSYIAPHIFAEWKLASGA